MKTSLPLILLSTSLFVFTACDLALDESSSRGNSEEGLNETPGGVDNIEDFVASRGSLEDAISLDGVVWLDPDISSWPRTASLNAFIANGVLKLQNDKVDTWPGSIEARGGGAINGVAWVFVNVNGTWHAATWEWLRKGQHEKLVQWVKGTEGHIHHPPLSTWVPRSGETYGFMVSTPARGGVRTINERSNVSLVRWP